MLAKKQQDRITLEDLKHHEIFKKHKLVFEGDLKTPCQSFKQNQISLANNKKTAQTMSTPRNCIMLDQEKKLIEKDLNRKMTVHRSFKDMGNAITLVDGNSVKKIDSASFFLHKTKSETSKVNLLMENPSPGLHSESSGTRSNFLESLENLSPTKVKSFQHTSVATDPIKVDISKKNIAEEMDNEFRRFMGSYNRHCEKTAKLSSVKNDNDRMVREINELQTQMAWKNTAITHARVDLSIAEALNKDIDAKLIRNRDRAMETLTKKNEEIKHLEEEIAKLMVQLELGNIKKP